MSDRSQELWAVVPVKSFASAKQRLSGMLAREERQTLARVMFEDVLSALMRARSLADVAVITGDAEASALAHAAGARVIADADDAGEIAAVTLAAQRLDGMGGKGMLVVPADVPLITPADIEVLVAAHRPAPSLTLVPASADGGTNALACSPPRVVPFAFGDDSFHRHREAAHARGIDPAVLHLERVGCDLDRPDDIASFIHRPSATRAYRYLSAINVSARLQALRGRVGMSLHAAPSLH